MTILFHHEYRVKLEAEYKRNLETFDKLEKSFNTMYELLTEWVTENPDRYVTQNRNDADFHGVEGDNIETFHMFLDEMEETILKDWEFDAVFSYVQPTMSRFDYMLKADHSINIKLYYYNSCCKQIKTGKMIPEKKWICN